MMIKLFLCMLLSYRIGFVSCQDDIVSFGGMEYKIYNQFANHSQARNVCASDNSTLVSLPDQTTQVLLMTSIYRASINRSLTGTPTVYRKLSFIRSSYWTSGFRNNTVDPWRWADGSAIPFSNETGFSNWRRGGAEILSSAPACLVLSTYVGVIEAWYPLGCSQSYFYICQKEIRTYTEAEETTGTGVNNRSKVDTSFQQDKPQLTLVGIILIAISAFLIIVALVLLAVTCKQRRRLMTLKKQLPGKHTQYAFVLDESNDNLSKKVSEGKTRYVNTPMAPTINIYDGVYEEKDLNDPAAVYEN